MSKWIVLLSEDQHKVRIQPCLQFLRLYTVTNYTGHRLSRYIFSSCLLLWSSNRHRHAEAQLIWMWKVSYITILIWFQLKCLEVSFGADVDVHPQGPHHQWPGIFSFWLSTLVLLWHKTALSCPHILCVLQRDKEKAPFVTVWAPLHAYAKELGMGRIILLLCTKLCNT